MSESLIRLNKKLLPLSWLYGAGVAFRNMLFEAGVLKSRTYAVPVISVGNITVGGTGKTPHVEYLAALLKDRLKVAVLSRGYKRKSRGFLIAGKDTPMPMIGDEAYQMKQKFPKVTIAVDKKRTRGIEQLTQNDSEKSTIDVILLDDAFQHRYVKPGINILLVDYHRLVIYDKLLPAGRLREPIKAKDRADIVIVTKCPKDLKPMEYRVITKALNLYPYQNLYFTSIDYEPLQPVFGANSRKRALDTLGDTNVLLLSGIASPRQLTEDITPIAKTVTPLTFADHHHFKRKDITQLNTLFDEMASPKCIITTEKDAARLVSTDGLSENVKQHLYVLPVHICFMLEQKDSFNQNILGYVRKNSRNSILAKGQNDHKPHNSHHSGDRPRTISFRNN